MTSWAAQVASSYSQDDSEQLRSLFDARHPALTGLARDLKAGSDLEKALSALKQLSKVPEYAALRRFCSSFLLFVREADTADPDKAYELLEAASQPAQLVLRDAAKPTFALTVKTYIILLLELALKADAMAPDRFESEYTDKRQKAVSSRCFNLVGAASDGLVEDTTLSKAALILFLTVTLYRIFFSIEADMQQFISIETRLSSVKGFRDILPALSQDERGLLEYFEGRVALIQRQLSRASSLLNYAAASLARSRSELLADALYYRAIALICTGDLSDPHTVLHSGALDAMFSPLRAPLAAGNYKQCEVVLDMSKAYHLERGTYFLLREKLEVLCWQALIRVTASAQPPAVNGPPTVPFQDIAIAAQSAFNAQDIDQSDAECICASLCEARLIKGYCAHSKGLLVLSKGDAFPIVRIGL